MPDKAGRDSLYYVPRETVWQQKQKGDQDSIAIFDFPASRDFAIDRRYRGYSPGNRAGMTRNGSSFLAGPHGRVRVVPGGQENDEDRVIFIKGGSRWEIGDGWAISRLN